MSGAIDAPEVVSAMFDRIAPRYDLMNRLMTGWQDQRWRRTTAAVAVGNGATRVLDAATGTGDLMLALERAGATEIIGVDASSEMLEQAAYRIRNSDKMRVGYADVMNLPFEDDEFDACTIGFGLRNLPDYQAGIVEMTRILKPGGKLVVLELTPLPNNSTSKVFQPYFRRVVPLAGRLITGDGRAYRYLPESVTNFPNAEALAGMMHTAGLTAIRWRYFGAGTVALHTGTKPELA